jgi:hypothetical protein
LLKNYTPKSIFPQAAGRRCDIKRHHGTRWDIAEKSIDLHANIRILTIALGGEFVPGSIRPGAGNPPRKRAYPFDPERDGVCSSFHRSKPISRSSAFAALSISSIRRPISYLSPFMRLHMTLPLMKIGSLSAARLILNLTPMPGVKGWSTSMTIRRPSREMLSREASRGVPFNPSDRISSTRTRHSKRRYFLLSSIIGKSVARFKGEFKPFFDSLSIGRRFEYNTGSKPRP